MLKYVGLGVVNLPLQLFLQQLHPLQVFLIQMGFDVSLQLSYNVLQLSCAHQGPSFLQNSHQMGIPARRVTQTHAHPFNEII